MDPNGVILSKLFVIDDYLLKLKNYLPVTKEELRNNWGLQKIIERSLQVMVESMIDIANRIISRNDGPLPITSSDSIVRLKDMGVIGKSETYIKMVRFRNLLVHNYDSLDVDILYAIVSSHLEDFEKFRREIQSHEKI